MPRSPADRALDQARRRRGAAGVGAHEEVQKDRDGIREATRSRGEAETLASPVESPALWMVKAAIAHGIQITFPYR